jgi:hypothetical protein
VLCTVLGDGLMTVTSLRIIICVFGTVGGRVPIVIRAGLSGGVFTELAYNRGVTSEGSLYRSKMDGDKPSTL